MCNWAGERVIMDLGRGITKRKAQRCLNSHIIVKLINGFIVDKLLCRDCQLIHRNIGACPDSPLVHFTTAPAQQYAKGVPQWLKYQLPEHQLKQGRIHGQNQSRTGGQGRKWAFSHFPTRSPRTDRPTNRRTDGRTKPLIESLVRD